MLKESHISIHTWPELNTCSLDLYSCSSNINKDNIINILNKYFKITQCKVQLIKREI